MCQGEQLHKCHRGASVYKGPMVEASVRLLKASMAGAELCGERDPPEGDWTSWKPMKGVNWCGEGYTLGDGCGWISACYVGKWIQVKIVPGRWVARGECEHPAGVVAWPHWLSLFLAFSPQPQRQLPFLRGLFFLHRVGRPVKASMKLLVGSSYLETAGDTAGDKSVRWRRSLCVISLMSNSGRSHCPERKGERRK